MGLGPGRSGYTVSSTYATIRHQIGLAPFYRSTGQDRKWCGIVVDEFHTHWLRLSFLYQTEMPVKESKQLFTIYNRKAFYFCLASRLRRSRCLLVDTGYHWFSGGIMAEIEWISVVCIGEQHAHKSQFQTIFWSLDMQPLPSKPVVSTPLLCSTALVLVSGCTSWTLLEVHGGPICCPAHLHSIFPQSGCAGLKGLPWSVSEPPVSAGVQTLTYIFGGLLRVLGGWGACYSHGYDPWQLFDIL